MTRSVVLSGPFLDVVVDTAVRSGLARVTDRAAFQLLRHYYGLFSRAGSEAAREQALSALVLWETAYVERTRWRGAVDLDFLERENLIAYSPDTRPRYLKALQRSDLTHPAVLSVDYLRPMLNGHVRQLMRRMHVFRPMEQAAKQCGLPFRSYEQQRLADLFIEWMRRGMTWEGLSSSSRWGNSRTVADPLLFAWIESATNVSSPEEEDLTVSGLVHRVVGVCAEYDFAAANVLPIALDVLPRARRMSLMTVLKEYAANQSAFRIFRLVLPDVGLRFQELKSLTDVLRLREDKRIQKFRSRMFDFARGLATNDTANLEAMREAVTGSLRELRGIRKWAATSKLITYLSVPVTAAESFLGLPTIGPALGVVGTAAEAASDFKRIKHDWVLLGASSS